MSQTAQIILSVGAAAFLAGLVLVAGIWAIRCKPDAPTYRNPLMILGIPTVLGAAWLLHRAIS
jgi:hypothetical protein